MYEIQVHEDGDIEIRRVPSAYKPPMGTTNVVKETYDDAAAELGTYGVEDDRINAALEAAENDWEWVTV